MMTHYIEVQPGGSVPREVMTQVREGQLDRVEIRFGILRMWWTV